MGVWRRDDPPRWVRRQRRRKTLEEWKDWLKKRAPTLITLTVIAPLGALYLTAYLMTRIGRLGTLLAQATAWLARKTGLPSLIRRVTER